MKLIGQFPPNVKIYWIEELKAIRVEWDKLFSSLEGFVKICDFVIDNLQKNQGNVWIVDTSDSNGVFSKEVQSYIQETLIKRAIEADINVVLTVVPKKLGLSSMSNKSWQKPVSNAGFITGDFPDFESCYKWLVEHQKSNVGV